VVETASKNEEGKIRLDKWLWFARVVKTRSIAQGLAVSGHVRVNGQRAESASKAIRIGDVLTIALPSRVRVLKVLDTAERRGPASNATALYDELG
jgi:ribosome-associated heat shock protein Hsp15